MNNNKDIDEIISHIQKLKKTKSKPLQSKKGKSDKTENKSKKSETSDSLKKVHKDNDEVGSSLQIEEQITIMNPKVIGFTDESTVSCDFCNQDIVLGKNLSGLVVADEFFACEKCCQEIPKEDLMEWTKTKMVSTNDVRPIGLWVIQQQGKNKKEKL